MKRILLLCALALSSMTLHAQRISVVSVGIADYPGTQNDLTLPIKDAKAIKEIYELNSKADVAMLTNKAATRSNVLSSLKANFAEAEKDDLVLFFFSGHGYKGGFLGYDKQISYKDIKQVFASCKAKNKMIFADACHAGQMREEERSSQGNQASEEQDVMLFLSSRGNELSIENPTMLTGFFTTYLKYALRGKADTNKDRTITAKELFDYVSSGVARLSKNKQHPVMWGKFDNDMPVMIW